jgi:ATP-dependent helicase HepA
MDRFLPPTVIRVVVDHQGKPFTAPIPTAILAAGDPRKLVIQETFRRELFPKMMSAAQAIAGTASSTHIEAARELARATIETEITRLEDLATRNPQVSPSEIQALKQTRNETLAALVSPRVRLDALRLIWRV